MQWSERFLWIHAAGFAVLPLSLAVSLLGLAASSLLPIWLELLVVGAVGILPIVWMQWQRPFYIFSILAVALQPDQLTVDQQRILSLFKTGGARLVTAIGAIAAALLLWQLYKITPLAVGILPFQSPFLGLLLAAAAFLASNLFWQIPLSVLRILLIPEAKLLATEPYPANWVRENFTVLGLQVKQILPPLVEPRPKATTSSGKSDSIIPEPSSTKAQPAATDDLWE